MPTTPIVDAHMHLWDTSAHTWYPGLAKFVDAGKPEIAGNFLLPDFDRGLGGIEVSGLVHVSATTEPRAYLAETRWVDAIAEADPRPFAIVGAVDPALPAAELIADLDEQARTDRFRGVRVFEGLAPNTPAAETIAGWLQEHDAVLDLVAKPAEILDWIDFLAGYPQLRVVLEHLGFPQGHSAEARSAWYNAISLAAKETQWLCKLSGFALICRDLTWPSLEYWLESSVSLWGWRRLMFASNMPVDSMAGTYTDLVSAIDRVVATDATEQEAEFFYRTNATDTYGLK
ncbi:amidohydrolase family protein [Nocardia sp. ET3-3]|uniref:Amidohydrolase family protein n=1 Tax=Nocardia terrae TaxID=2675851 RepID=A0A7K1V319_9NOCA|nr:amidohydrolase family protein [Nocardia terrae]MVU80528.1 amidohydrolase family protein [Nocardia terrae]